MATDGRGTCPTGNFPQPGKGAPAEGFDLAIAPLVFCQQLTSSQRPESTAREKIPTETEAERLESKVSAPPSYPTLRGRRGSDAGERGPETFAAQLADMGRRTAVRTHSTTGPSNVYNSCRGRKLLTMDSISTRVQ